jgi:diadenosine tetraphosphate (Ap4A) HIT family hydrolase
MRPHACDLCASIDPAVACCALERHLRSGQHRVVAATASAAAVPTIGAFVPGYLLVVPRRHVLALGQLPPPELRDFEHLTHRLAARLARTYAMPILGFEYGLNITGERRVEHAHLHLVPTSADLGGWLTERLNGFRIPGLTSLPARRDGSYIAVLQAGAGVHVYPVPSNASPRIRLREAVAALDPRVSPGAWDWQASPFPGLMRQTIDDLAANPHAAVSKLAQ